MRTGTLALILAGANVAASQGINTLPGAGNVALPLDEYNRLVELAGNRPVQERTGSDAGRIAERLAECFV